MPLFLFAQKEGTIVFTETIQLQIDLPEEAKQYAMHLPKEQKSLNALYFNANESLYKTYEGAEDETIEHEEGDGMMRMVIKRPDYRIYKNLGNSEKLVKQEFFGRNFLIKESPDKMNWKITAEQKKILDYTCMKAVYQDTSKTVEAWFTPQIAVSNGPGSYDQLPGMILEVNVDNGKRTIVAKSVELKTLEKDAIKKPKKGKKVSREEFEEISEKKMKEMEAEMGGNGSFQIKIRN